jgi:glutamate/tyrosine decarboxylase-like PLP-dependent enzyme
MTANKPSDAIPEVMKRRIKELERDGYNKDFLRCFRNAIRSLDETDRYAHANKVQAEEIKALAARLQEAERLIADTRPCVESWKHKHERAYKAAQRRADTDHMEWHAENVTSATELLTRIDARHAVSASGVQR